MNHTYHLSLNSNISTGLLLLLCSLSIVIGIIVPVDGLAKFVAVIVLGIPSLIFLVTSSDLRIISIALMVRPSLDLFSDINIIGSINPAAVWALLIMMVWLCRFLIKKYAIREFTSIGILAYVLLIVVGGLSILVNNLFYNSASLSDIVRILSNLVIFSLVFHATRDKSDLRIVLLSIILSAVIPLALGFYGALSGFRTTTIAGVVGIARVSGTFAHPNNFGHYLLLSFIATVVYIRLYDKNKLMVRVIQVLQIANLILTFSRSSWFGFVVTTLLFSSLTRRPIVAIRNVVLVLIFGLVIYQFVPEFVDYTLDVTIVSANPNDSTLAGRFAIWARARALLGPSTILGFGPRTFERMVGYDAHNDYLRVWFEFGWTGLALYIVSQLSLIVTALKFRRVAPTIRAKELANSTITILVTFSLLGFFANIFIFPVLQWYIFAFLGATYATATSNYV